MFQGSFEEVKLPDVIQLMSVSAKTGCFHLSRETENGRIYLQEGQIVHAVNGNLRGEDALYALAIWEDGSFDFKLGEPAPESTIAKRNTTLLMEVARKLEEWRVLRKRVPSLDLIPELHTLGDKKISFNTQEWHVLSKINGVNNIKRIAGLTSMTPVDAAKLIYGLVSSNLVNLRSTPKPNPDLNPLESKNREKPAARTPDEEQEWLSHKIERIYQISKKALGESAFAMVQRHCANGIKNIKQNKGMPAVIETATQIVRAAKLKSPPERVNELTRVLKKIIKEP